MQAAPIPQAGLPMPPTLSLRSSSLLYLQDCARDFLGQGIKIGESKWKLLCQCLVALNERKLGMARQPPFAIDSLAWVRCDDPVLQRGRSHSDGVCGLGLLPNRNQGIRALPFARIAEALDCIER